MLATGPMAGQMHTTAGSETVALLACEAHRYLAQQLELLLFGVVMRCTYVRSSLRQLYYKRAYAPVLLKMPLQGARSLHSFGGYAFAQIFQHGGKLRGLKRRAVDVLFGSDDVSLDDPFQAKCVVPP